MIFKRITKNSYRDHGGNIVSVIPFPLNRHFFFFALSRKYVQISRNTFENHFSLVKNVTEKSVSVSTVAPMTNDYTL